MIKLDSLPVKSEINEVCKGNPLFSDASVRSSLLRYFTPFMN